MPTVATRTRRGNQWRWMNGGVSLHTRSRPRLDTANPCDLWESWRHKMTLIIKSTIRMKSAKPWLWLEKADNEETIEEICLFSSPVNAALAMAVMAADGWQRRLAGRLGEGWVGGTGGTTWLGPNLQMLQTFPKAPRGFCPSTGNGKRKAEIETTLGVKGKEGGGLYPKREEICNFNMKWCFLVFWFFSSRNKID